MLRRATSGLELANLWTKAADHLNEEDQQQFGFSQDDKRAALESLIQTIDNQKNDTIKAQLVIQRKRGKPIVLREVLAKIVSCVNKFKEVGDIITQYDPAHAALPWAAVRLILQAAVSEQQIYDSMLEGLEHVADVIARYAWVETLYLHASSKMRLQLQDSIVKLYIAILEFLAKARRYYSKHTYQRVLKSLVQVDEQAVQKYIRAIAEKEEKVNNIARLVDAQYLREISKTMEGGFSSLLSRVDRISRQVAELQVESGKPKPPTDEEKKDMLKWLDPVSTFDDFHTAKTARQIGTCDWILRREEFQDWLNPEESSGVAKILWLHGKPGTGKTILSARIAEYLLGDRSRLFAFFFCFYGNDLKRDCNSIIKAWIAQIVKQDFDACNIALAVHREKEGNFANRFELWLIFRKINALARRQYYLIDGFDECDRNDDTFPKHGLVDAKTRFLTELIEAIDGTGTRVVIMSRPDAEVRDQMQAQMQRPGVTEFDWADYSITSDDTSADLKCFAQSMMNFRIPNRDLDLRQELAAEAADKADGMFLWIKLLYSQLSRSKSPPRLRKIITDTPSGLDQAYERDILNILGLEYEERVRAIAILRWTLFALRPLTIRQLSEALLVELRDDDDDSEDERMSRFGYGGQSNSDDNETDEENDHGSASTFLPLDEVPNFSEDDSFGNEFLKACGSLIELRGGDSFKAEDRTIHFVHFSVQEYLLKSTNINLPSLSELKFSDRSYSHGRLAQVYLQYLLYDDFKQTTSSTLEEFDKRRRKFAFLDYAGSTWGWHADRCRPLPNFILTLCKELLDPQNAKWLSYSEVVGGRANGSFQTFITQFRDSYPRPLFYASFWGIVDCMRFLVNERKEDVNHVGGLYGSPLKAAIAHGHEDAVSFLLENGANIYLDGGQYGTVVNTAAATGQVKILAMLLELKPDISLKGGWLGEPPLVAAHRSSRTSVENIVERLLDAAIGAVNVLKIFVNRQINLDCLDAEGRTPLMHAIELGRHDAADFLVCNGADISLRDPRGHSLLHLAVASYIEFYQTDTISLLLAHHADVNALSSRKSTPLHFACQFPDVPIVKMLLDRGADPTLKNQRDRTALDLAARSLRSDFAKDPLTLQRLLDFQLSSEEDEALAVIELLLQNGKHGVAKDQDRKITLQLALERSGEDSDIFTDSGDESLGQSEDSGNGESDEDTEALAEEL